MRDRLAAITLTPRQFSLLATVSLVALTLIVLTGAAVRLTGSGLGCPGLAALLRTRLPAPADPRGDRVLEPHRVGLRGRGRDRRRGAAWRRRPFRRDLALLALALPLGVVAQAVLGGYTVEQKLAPGLVMGHFVLSMVILVAAARSPGGRASRVERRRRAARRRGDRSGRFARCFRSRALVDLRRDRRDSGRPHSGGATGQQIKRLTSTAQAHSTGPCTPTARSLSLRRRRSRACGCC